MSFKPFTSLRRGIGMFWRGLDATRRFVLNSLFLIVLIALLVPLWKGKRQTASWALAGIAAVLTWYLIGGYWGILSGAIVGALAGAYLDD